MPSCDEVAALIVGDFDNLDPDRDIIVRKTSGYLEKIKETHVLFFPLQYPLLLPFGEDQYQEIFLSYRIKSTKETERGYALH